MLREFGDYYYPTLIIRPDEVKGLNELPAGTKDSIFPIFQLCPWVGSAEFTNTHAKVSEIYEDRPCIVDLDRTYYKQSDRPAVQYFHNLVSGSDKADEWMSLISENEYYVPCVQHEGVEQEKVLEQINFFAELERGFAFRIRSSEILQLDNIVDYISFAYDLVGPTSILVIVDCGMIENFIFTEQRLRTILTRLVPFENIRIVVSSASFPREFGFVDGVDTSMIESRRLYQNALRQFNNLFISYSDWGSTKPRVEGIFGTPLNRVDYPTQNQWVFARSKTQNWSFSDAAAALVLSEYWADPPNVWGVQQIELAATSDPFSLNTRQKSAAARINIHLFVQDNYGLDLSSINTDEDWEDL